MCTLACSILNESEVGRISESTITCLVHMHLSAFKNRAISNHVVKYILEMTKIRKFSTVHAEVKQHSIMEFLPPNFQACEKAIAFYFGAVRKDNEMI